MPTAATELESPEPSQKKATHGLKAPSLSVANPPSPRQFTSNIFPNGPGDVPAEFALLVARLEADLKMPTWLLVQNGEGEWHEINAKISKKFFETKNALERGKPIALIIDSPGGFARCAYQIANLIRKHCGTFIAVVPQYAKSAATLIALGADSIILGSDAELGPLDAQFMDMGREEVRSALDEVQSLERLFASALEAVDQCMQLLVARTQKKVDSLLVPTLHFVSDMMRPMIEKIDVVHYTQTSRVLKVAEEYASRLLFPQYSQENAKRIARHLVEKYPEHGFVIDSIEASRFGLRTTVPTAEQSRIFEEMLPFLNKLTIIGKIESVNI